MSPTLPDEQAALLGAIAADPDDDTPRLVYADWLQENGDEGQAEFIRMSIRIEGLENHEDDLRQALAWQLDLVADGRGAEWLAALGVTGAQPAFERGLIEGLVYDCLDQFLEDAPRLFERVPVRTIAIRELELHGRDGLVVLSELPYLLRLRELRLENRWVPVSSDGWERLVTSPHVASLEVLTMHNAALTDDNVLPLTQCEYLTNLEELGLSGNQLSAAGALAVVRSRNLPKLNRLGLACNDIVEDRRRGSAFLALRDALFERFGGLQALSVEL